MALVCPVFAASAQTILDGLDLGPMQRATADVLGASFGQWQSVDQIIDAVFADRADGGPDYAYDCVRRYLDDLAVMLGDRHGLSLQARCGQRRLWFAGLSSGNDLCSRVDDLMLTPVERQFAQVLARNGGQWLTMDRLLAAFEERPSWRNPRMVANTHMTRLRKKCRAANVRIDARRGARRMVLEA